MAGKILIRFVGHNGVRILGDYEWNPENNHIVAVDAETAADLLTYPRPQFHLVQDQEMSSGDAQALADALGVAKAEIDKVVTTSSPAPPKLTDIDGIGEARREELAEQGVDSVSALAAQDDDGIEHLATNTGASRGQIREWVQAARELTED
jgi:predicted flap endonuclease-1-like 5' DNA nuclease